MKILIDKNGRRFKPAEPVIVNMLTGDTRPWGTPAEELSEHDVPYNGNVGEFQAALEVMGIHEIDIPDLPDGVTERTHYIHYPDDEPYITWAEKAPDQVQQLQDMEAMQAAVRLLDESKHLFEADRYEELCEEEPERATQLKAARKEARATIKAYKAKYMRV